MSNPVLSPFPAKPVAMPAGTPFRIASDFTPAGDQPQAIRELTQGLLEGERDQVLLGVTGSGKTFTAAQAIAALHRPASALAPTKPLPAQPSAAMKSLFPAHSPAPFLPYYHSHHP